MTTWTMKTPLAIPKAKRIPHTSGRMGAMARDCPIGVEVVLLLLLLCVPQTLATGCVFVVCVCFFHVIFECWCVCGVCCFVPK